MTKLNFKTKKVTLPIDINKTYVLVDVEEYVKYASDNAYYTSQHYLEEPFQFSRVGSDYGYLNGDIIIGSGETEYEFFREVIGYPENGDAVIMTETYATGRYIAYDDKQHMHVINVDGVLVYVEDNEFELKQEPSWQEQLCEEFDIDYNKDEDSFKFLRDYSSDGAIKLAKRIIELNGE